MLMLSREVNEKVIVGDDIHVTVLAVHGMKVLLGFNAPKKISVHREEIYKKIQDKTRTNYRNYEVETVNLDLNNDVKSNPLSGGK